MKTKFHSVTRVSAVELAEFMGISARSLTRLDEKGVLVAYRSENGRRVYTTDHLQKALEIMSDSSARNVNVKFLKNGENSIYGRVSMPRRWLEKLGITAEDPSAAIRFDGESVIITKTTEPLPWNKKPHRIYIDESEENNS